MDLKQTEDFLRRLRRKPGATTGLALALMCLIAGGAWLVAYFTESGRQAAAPETEVGSKKVAASPDGNAGAGLASLNSSDESQLTRQAAPRGFGIEQVIVGSGTSGSTVDITFRNSRDEPVLVRELAVSGSENSFNLCSSYYAESMYRVRDRSALFLTAMIRINDLVATERAEGAHHLRGNFSAADEPEFRFPVTGMYLHSCGSSSLRLHITVSVPIEPRSVQMVRVVVPTHLRVESIRFDGRERAARTAERLPLDLPMFEQLDVRATTSAGVAEFAADSPERPEAARPPRPPRARVR